jgi:hypothetical protein
MAESSSLSDFQREGYAVHRGVLPKPMLDFIAAEYQMMLANKRLRYNDGQVEHGYAAYGLIQSETLMQMLLPFAEEKSGYRLFPTYSYGRVYVTGAELTRHKDRPSCEISLSVMISQTGDRPWPLFFETKSGEARGLELQPGDLVMYRGMELTHWREPFQGETQLQLFLHYVRQDGPHAEHKFDKRARLGAPSVYQVQTQQQSQPKPALAIFNTPSPTGKR